MENNNYNYPIKKILKKDFCLLDDTLEHLNIRICAYKINIFGKHPFLEFLLANTGFECLSLPFLTNYKSLNINELLSYSKVFLSGILKINNFEIFESKILFDGFYEYLNDVYLFFDLSKYDTNIDDIYSYDPFRFALIDEIINCKHICNMYIDNDTVNFFIKNESINYLYNDKNEPFEIPVVGYVGKPTTQKTKFVYTFGESAKDKSAILGPYFYFTDYENAIKQGKWSNNFKPEYLHGKLVTDNEYGKYIQGGIIRFALFIGKTKYIENSPNDIIDESEIKKQRLDDIHLNKNYEILTLRISDHDGLWAKIYDSVHIGHIYLDNGIFLKDTPIIVVKNYNQQVPLSYHFVDNRNCSYGIV